MPRVLVVDDNRLIRMLVSQALRDGGHSVVEAEDGEKALVAFKTFHPDVVVTDFYMPGMLGDELVRRIRAEPDPKEAGIPIIGLAGTSDSEKRLSDAGTNRYLPKPFKEKQLLAAIQEAMTEQQQEG